MDKPEIAYTVVVSGVVQGVGFRYFTRQQAQLLGLRGNVQNQADGTVLIHVDGTEIEVHKFLDWCHHGPDTATVEKLEYRASPPSGLGPFHIIR